MKRGARRLRSSRAALIAAGLACPLAALAQAPSPADLPLSRTLRVVADRDARLDSGLRAVAESLERSGQWASAIQTHELLYDTFDPTPDRALRVARAIAFSGDVARAEEHLKRLIGAHPEHIDASLMLARLLLWQGRTDEAMSQVLSALELDPARAEILVLAGQIKTVDRDFEAAATYWDQALELAPQDPVVLAAVARGWLAAGRPERARVLRKALVAAGDVATVRMIDEYSPPPQSFDFRVDLAYSHSFNADREPWHELSAGFSWRASESATVGFRADTQLRTDLGGGNTDVFLALTGHFRSTKWLNLDLEVGFTPEPDYRPMVSFLFQQTFELADIVDFYIYNKLWSFKDAVAPGDNLWINQIGPGLVWHFGPVDLDMSYRASVFDDADPGHFGVVRIDVRPFDALWFLAGASYGAGAEIYFAGDPVTQDTLSAFAGVGFSPMVQHGFEMIWSYYTTDPNGDDLPVTGLVQNTITGHWFFRF